MQSNTSSSTYTSHVTMASTTGVRNQTSPSQLLPLLKSTATHTIFSLTDDPSTILLTSMGLLMQTGKHAPKLVATLLEFVFDLLASQLHISANYN
jgi:hypothetical protein